MSKLDLGVAVGGIALLLVSAGSLMYVQEFADLQDWSFPTQEAALDAQGPSAVGADGVAFTWAIGDEPSPYAANMSIDVQFSGQAVQGGDAVVSLHLMWTPSDDEAEATSATQTYAMPIPAGSSNAASTFAIDLSWAMVPESVRTQEGRLPDAAGGGTLTLEVDVEPASELVAGLGSASFEATAQGIVSTYSAVQAS